jgi:hypothetical protein
MIASIAKHSMTNKWHTTEVLQITHEAEDSEDTEISSSSGIYLEIHRSL